MEIVGQAEDGHKVYEGRYVTVRMPHAPPGRLAMAGRAVLDPGRNRVHSGRAPGGGGGLWVNDLRVLETCQALRTAEAAAPRPPAGAVQDRADRQHIHGDRPGR